MKIKLWLTFAIVASLGVIAFAGWDHSQNQTRWVDRPTVATCWLRLSNDLVPSERIQVFNDTIRDYHNAGTDTNTVINSGYWYLDSDGDVAHYLTVSKLHCPTNDETILKAAGAWVDCEWTMDMDGDLLGKE